MIGYATFQPASVAFAARMLDVVLLMKIQIDF